MSSHLHDSRFLYDLSRGSSVSDNSDILQVEKSPESGFWWATSKQISDGSSLPAVDGLERETGPLPPGAYQTIDPENGSPYDVCLIGVKIRPPAPRKQQGDIWTQGVVNCQKMVDSGFNGFSVGSSHGDVAIRENQIDKTRLSKKDIEARKKMEDQYTSRTLQRHEYEKEFYAKLRQDTPSSILRSCHFAVDMEVPSILHVSDFLLDKNKAAPAVAYGNGWAVRKSISDALLRVKTDCLDSVFLECKFLTCVSEQR